MSETSKLLTFYVALFAQYVKTLPYSITISSVFKFIRSLLEKTQKIEISTLSFTGFRSGVKNLKFQGLELVPKKLSSTSIKSINIE